MPTPTTVDGQIAYSISAYAQRAAVYDDIHCEIFNPAEQERLRNLLIDALGELRSGGRRALDYGCGSGNLTRHLVALGLDVTAADLSPEFLRLVQQRFAVRTIHLANGDVENVPDGTFDFIGLYSVLHHIPDYLGAARALVRKLKPGGVITFDHETNGEAWRGSDGLRSFQRALADHEYPGWWAPHRHRWQHLLRGAISIKGHRRRIRRWRDPRCSEEGDIHIWPDDHIEFDKLAAAVKDGGGEVIRRDNYLLHNGLYPDTIWERYRFVCADTGCLVARRVGSD